MQSMHPSHIASAEQKRQAAAERLRCLLEACGYRAEHCGRPLDADSLEWWMGCTEYGTGYGGTQLICRICGETLAEVETWGQPEDVLDAVEVLEDDVESLKRELARSAM